MNIICCRESSMLNIYLPSLNIVALIFAVALSLITCGESFRTRTNVYNPNYKREWSIYQWQQNRSLIACADNEDNLSDHSIDCPFQDPLIL